MEEFKLRMSVNRCCGESLDIKKKHNGRVEKKYRVRDIINCTVH
jgi:hypothetical protein